MSTVGNFVDQLFPNPGFAHELKRGISAATTIVSNGNVEYRLQKQKNYRIAWTWPAHGMLWTDWEEIALFISDVAYFGLNSFKFKDPRFNSWNNTQLLYTGSANRYYLTMRGIQDTHPVYHLDPDVTVKLNGSPTTFTKVIVNGVPMIEVPSTGTVTINGHFYFAVRLDQPEVAVAMVGLSAGPGPLVDAYDELRLVEVAEY